MCKMTESAMNKTRHWMLAAILTLCGIGNSMAQGNLAGRVYYNANIMNDHGVNKDFEKNIAEARKQAIAKEEKEKGRKLTASELADMDKRTTEARKKAMAIKKGTVVKLSVEFKSEKDAVMKADMSVSDDALKAAGIGWAKRKAIRAALAVAPSSSKVTYTVKGNLVIVNDDNELDTLRLSPDGKYLYGKYEKDTDFKLTRTK